MRAGVVPGAVFPDSELLPRCRPDLDISSAAQRTAWKNGEKASFSPFGRAQAQVFADQD
jgi:hypothetical protein